VVQRLLAVSTVFVCLLGAALSVEHLLDDEHYNPGFYAHPRVMQAHVILGAGYLLLALPQFVARLRARRPRLHRATGRVAVAVGLVAGTTALYITFAFPFSGWMAIPVVAPFGCLFVFALARGFWLARRRRFAEHREWMIRALAIGTSIATMRLLFVPALFGFGEATDERARWLSLVCFAAAFAIHLAVAESWIRATRAAAAPPPLSEPPPAWHPPARRA
jgi:uncharacterized membrane protein